MWVSDGSPEISIEGNRVSCKADPSAGSEVYNAFWKNGEGDTGMQNGKAYWKVTCEKLEDSLFVGVTDQEKFGKGWSCKGLLYGGNLSDGGGLLVSSFGPWPKTGDVIGILVDVDSSSIKVYFDINDRPLGLAFHVPRSTLSNVFPVLHFSGNGTVTFQKGDAIPTNTSREEEKFEGLKGHWEYSSGPFDKHGTTPTVEIRGNPNNYKATLHVVNTCHVLMTPSAGTGKWVGAPGATTLMGSSPELMQLENEIVQHFSGTISLNESGNLAIVKGDRSSVWKRFTPQKAAVTENPFQ